MQTCLLGLPGKCSSDVAKVNFWRGDNWVNSRALCATWSAEPRASTADLRAWPVYRAPRLSPLEDPARWWRHCFSRTVCVVLAVVKKGWVAVTSEGLTSCVGVPLLDFHVRYRFLQSFDPIRSFVRSVGHESQSLVKLVTWIIIMLAIMMGLVVVLAVADRGAAVAGGLVGISFLRRNEVEIADGLFTGGFQVLSLTQLYSPIFIKSRIIVNILWVK